MRTQTTRGFTLIEIVVVMLIIGVVMGLMTANIDSLTPSSRIMAGGREIGATVRLAIDQAVMTGKATKIFYQLDERYYQILVPQDASSEYEALEPTYLPRDVFFKEIEYMAEKSRKQREGYLTFTVSPMGTMAGHVVHLGNKSEMEVSVEINPLSGLVSIKEGDHAMSFLEKP